MRRAAALCSLLVLLLAACGGKSDKEQANKSCGPAPPAPPVSPTLPAKFPTPGGVIYTASKKAGPSTIIDGYLKTTIGPAHDTYTSAFPKAGYTVTKEEQDAADAEVNFAYAGTTGQVKLVQVCSARTTLEITIRPS
jgi:hypothetical protein